MNLTESQLNTINNYAVYNDYWSLSNNCSSFASGLWNSVCTSSKRVSAGYPKTPANLSNSIKSKTGYSTGAAVPYDYLVMYAQGGNTPQRSTQY